MNIYRELFDIDTRCRRLSKRLDSLSLSITDTLGQSVALYQQISHAVIAAKIVDIQETRHLEALLEDRDRTLQDLFLRGIIPTRHPNERRP